MRTKEKFVVTQKVKMNGWYGEINYGWWIGEWQSGMEANDCDDPK